MGVIAKCLENEKTHKFLRKLEEFCL